MLDLLNSYETTGSSDNLQGISRWGTMVTPNFDWGKINSNVYFGPGGVREDFTNALLKEIDTAGYNNALGGGPVVTPPKK